jgi:NADH-quinone oxidoreductase subunit L
MNGTADNLNGVLLVLVPVLPLLAAVLGYALILLRARGAARLSALLGGVALLTSAVLSAALFLDIQQSGQLVAFASAWLKLPNGPDGLEVPLAFLGGDPQLLFALTTALIGVAVLVFAARERRGDERAGVFFATLTLFAGGMLLFLTADTLILLYIAWELMGLCSYLLITHPGTAEARRAARQAFWTTRATDFGLLFAVLIMMTLFNWSRLSQIDINGFLNGVLQAGGDPHAVLPWFSAVALLVLLAVLGKAAQLPLSFWLADAMVAPAPVSALLHAATMVAAGPYLLTRVRELLLASDVALLAGTLLGGLTLLLGAAMALCAVDPKRVLAYSTVSHLGLVIVGASVIAEEAGFYHLLAHAWFKAALFLGVGYLVAVWLGDRAADGGVEHRSPVITDLAGTARRHPLLLWGVLVPSGLSLAGVPYLAGALGKEQILYALLTRYRVAPRAEYPDLTFAVSHPLATAGWWAGSMMLVLAIPLTAAYITRLVGVLGWGRVAQKQPVVHLDEGGEVPPGAASAPAVAPGWGWPLALASALALIGSVGWAVVYFAWYATPAGFIAEKTLWKWQPVPALSYGVTLAVSLIGVLVGIGLTWYLRVARPAIGARTFSEGGLAWLAHPFRHGLYLREVFKWVVSGTGEFLAVLAGRADIGLVDWLALKGGWLGRVLAGLARWVDNHIVDGLRWLACELWWTLKRLHARFMQTGHIQHYMLIVLIGAALLCLVVLRPLSHILAQILGRM